MKPSSCQANHGPAGSRSAVSTVTQPISGVWSRCTEPPSAAASACAPKQMPSTGSASQPRAATRSRARPTSGPSPRAVAPEPSAITGSPPAPAARRDRRARPPARSHAAPPSPQQPGRRVGLGLQDEHGVAGWHAMETAGARRLGHAGVDGRARVVADVLGRGRRASRPRRARARRSTPGSRSSTPRTSTGRARPRRAWGEILSDYPRDSYVLATKALLPDGPARPRAVAPADPQADRRRRSSGCGPTTSTSTSATATTTRVALEETMGALTEVVEAGKARQIGFSEWPADKIAGGAGAAGRGQVRVEPAAVQRALAQARGRGDPALRGQRDHARSSGRRSPRAC